MYVLASTSPRRKELFKYIVSDFDIVNPECDETIPDGTPVYEIPRLIAIQKANAIAKKRPDDIIVGSDTLVTIDGIVFGKPKNREEAKRMLQMLSGKNHSVLTGVAIIRNGEITSFVSETIVSFYDLTDEVIEKYIDTGEPMDKAGAYGIQGYGSILVKKIDGDFFTVMGLPVSQTAKYLGII